MDRTHDYDNELKETYLNNRLFSYFQSSVKAIMIIIIIFVV